MNLGTRIAVISDVHGEHRMLSQVLQRCRDERVESVVLLGDLFDRLDQAEPCARFLNEWEFTGVIGNHEREALKSSGAPVDHSVTTLLDRLQQRLEVDDALFVHDEMDWKAETNGTFHSGRPHSTDARLVFAGHTHYRMAKDDQGPIDLSLGIIRIHEKRCYVINPGAVIEGQFAIWDRNDSTIAFERI